MPPPPDCAALFAFCDLHASRVRGSVYERLLDPVMGPGPRYYDRQGFPIPGDGSDVGPTLAWARMLEADPLLRTVAQTDFPDGSLLSTAWLGLDHGFGGRPLFFETMYFSGEIETHVLRPSGHEFQSHPELEFPVPGAPGETTTQLRYGSEEEALASHREIARRIRKRWEV
jgi:hypothetical protein